MYSNYWNSNTVNRIIKNSQNEKMIYQSSSTVYTKDDEMYKGKIVSYMQIKYKICNMLNSKSIKTYVVYKEIVYQNE